MRHPTHANVDALTGVYRMATGGGQVVLCVKCGNHLEFECRPRRNPAPGQRAR